MRALIVSGVVALFVSIPLPAAKTLDIYVIDVEGGKSVLLVSPAGESMLIDAGWPREDARDTNRILDVIKLAKVKRIDYLVVTHYDTDHAGNVPSVADKVPVRNFVDHGVLGGGGKANEGHFRDYTDFLAKHPDAKRITVKPGESKALTYRYERYVPSR